MAQPCRPVVGTAGTLNPCGSSQQRCTWEKEGSYAAVAREYLLSGSRSYAINGLENMGYRDSVGSGDARRASQSLVGAGTVSPARTAPSPASLRNDSTEACCSRIGHKEGPDLQKWRFHHDFQHCPSAFLLRAGEKLTCS